MNRTLILIVLFFAPVITSAIEPPMDLYQKILAQYVKTETHDGVTLNWVNYSSLKNDTDFTQLVNQIAEFSPEQLDGAQEQMAFYINAYNILALKTVADHWPVKSIKDIGSFLKPVWKKEAGNIGGKQFSLDEIEHEVLRPMGDPRIHMAIVCASVSCPDLRTEPYTANKLNEQLNDQADNFLSNPQKGLNVKGNEAKTSKIFDWFADDFIKANGSVRDFIKQYSDISEDITLTRGGLPYNWSVNGE